MKIVKVGLPIILAGVLAVLAVNLIKKRIAEDEKNHKALVYPIVVDSFTPKEENITLSLPYMAIVKNDKDVVINSKFAGKLLYIKSLGSEVKKGEIVAKIDDSDLNAKLKDINSKIASLKDKLKAEKINLKNLFATHQRTKKLLDVKMASIEEYQTEESKIASLKASIKADKNSIVSLQANKNSVLNNLTYTEIKSPINGIISAKFVNVGDNVFISKPILKIASKNGNYLFITLSELKKEIIYKNKRYKLTPLNSSVDSLLAFKAIVDDKNLINGQKVEIEVVEFSGKGVKVPYDSVLSINNKNYIFNTQGKAKEITIIAKGKDGVVVDNINEDIIVAKPDILLKIKAGYPIKIKD